MSTRVGSELPTPLLEFFDGAHFEDHRDTAFTLVTVDERGWPYVAMLSLLEAIAPDRRNIRLGLYNNSATSANLRRDGRTTLIVVDEGMVYYVQGTAEELSGDLPGFEGITKVNMRIESVYEDRARDEEGNARVTSGIRFRIDQMDADRIQRARNLRAALCE
ncbi:MAG: pyridoxamine 5'-phosphate oxidase family protein [Chloroflexi bacterium]|nr:pyridoxamine 5'-phosphate oxidase family protein [Chloroflexota bacterium]